MSLETGSQLGPYRVQGSVGAGGMGEVYRALDPRLGREVAVKVLPAHLVSDAEHLQRFEQEARAVGALNHPNIMSVFDFGSHEGSPYVVFELLEGETLRQRLGGSALPVRKALDYSAQFARGLAAAHERGIVHRDLKPENLFITREGRVKILDFGLAKLTAPAASPAEATRPQTAILATEPGKLLGTVGYMSPEQVRARPADHRSDIFTFGSILYEMLSGQRAFRGESAVETMNSILKEDPPELSATNRNLPPELERIVRHCLEKSPEERFQSARDLAFDIESISGSMSTLAGAGAGAGALGARAATTRRPRWAMPLAAAGVLAVVAAGAFIAGRTAGGAGRASLFGGGAGAGAGAGSAAGAGGGAGDTLPGYMRLTFRRGQVRNSRFTPDGRTVVYAASWGADPLTIFTTAVGSAESRALGFAGSDLLSVSTRGELALGLNIIYGPGFARRSTLGRVPLTGEAPREVLAAVEFADWSPDGEKLAVVRDVAGRSRLEMPPETVLYESSGWISNARISPQGDRIAFIDHPLRGDDGGKIVVVEPGKPAQPLGSSWLSVMGLAWSPDGREIWFTATKSGFSRVIQAVSLSGQERTVASAPGTLTLQDVSPSTGSGHGPSAGSEQGPSTGSGHGPSAGSGQGEVHVLVTRDDQRMGIIGRGPGDTQDKDLSWLDWSLVSDISADGKTFLFSETGEGGGDTYSAFVRKTDGSPAVRVGEGAGFALSPDGKWVALRKTGENRGLELVPTGPGTARTIPTPGLEVHAGRFFPDGQHLLLAANEKGGPVRAYVVPIAGGAFRVLSPPGIDTRGAAISPDGTTVVLVSSDAEQRILLVPTDGGPARSIPNLGNEYNPVRWSSDGRSLYVRRRNKADLLLERVDVRTGKREPVKEIQPGLEKSGITRAGVFMMTGDAKAWVMSYSQSTSDLYLVQGVK